MTKQLDNVRFAFFGSSRFSVFVLDELEKAGLTPVAAVTTPDKPAGRKLGLTPTPVKIWASNRGIRVFEPARLSGPEAGGFADDLKGLSCDVFIVASYGKIIPGAIMNIPVHKTLNVHPSLLPKYRGASPLQSAMLDDAKDTGITVMMINEKMDEGPIVSQKPVTVSQWPVYEEFEEMMAREGGRLLAETLPGWLVDGIGVRDQDHSKATYSRKIIKEDGLLNPSGDPYLNFRKIQAYHEWPGAYFVVEKEAARNGKNGENRETGEMRKIRVKVTAASFRDGKLVVERVVPEGGRDMDYRDFNRGLRA